MFKLEPRTLQWLKGFHLIAVCCWIGGAVALILLHSLRIGITDGGALHGINQSAHHIDMFVVVLPGAIGCLATGIIYSVFTHWGFFKYRWVTFKWVLTVAAILFGTFFLGPWEEKMLEISGKLGIQSMADGDYLYSQKMNLIFGSIQVSLLIATVFVSIFKPWKSTGSRDSNTPVQVLEGNDPS